MGKKRIQKIPKTVKLKCPLCLQITQINLEKTDKLSSYICNKCENEIKTPMMRCCVVCAFSNKKCPYSLKVEAHSRGWELR